MTQTDLDRPANTLTETPAAPSGVDALDRASYWTSLEEFIHDSDAKLSEAAKHIAGLLLSCLAMMAFNRKLDGFREQIFSSFEERLRQLPKTETFAELRADLRHCLARLVAALDHVEAPLENYLVRDLNLSLRTRNALQNIYGIADEDSIAALHIHFSDRGEFSFENFVRSMRVGKMSVLELVQALLELGALSCSDLAIEEKVRAGRVAHKIMFLRDIDGKFNWTPRYLSLLGEIATD